MSCDADTKTAFEGFVADHPDGIDAPRSVRPQNLDGDTATWIVIATLSAQVIPHFLTFVNEVLNRRRMGRLVLDGLEIDNPSQEDLVLFRQMLRKRLKTGDDHDDAASAG